jgi:hypothetical protein
MSKHNFGEVCGKDFCPVCSLGETKPCNNCGGGVPSDVWAEELGFCVPCQHEFFDDLPEGFCGHFVRSCPFGDDCNSFCPVCEGGGDYCRVCCDYPVELLPRAGDVS